MDIYVLTELLESLEMGIKLVSSCTMSIRHLSALSPHTERPNAYMQFFLNFFNKNPILNF